MEWAFGHERKVPPERLVWLQRAIIAVALLLLVSFWRLQVARSDFYVQLAERNRIRTLPIMAPRGLILDRDGQVLVDNYPAFSVLLVREHPQGPGDSLVPIARYLHLDFAKLRNRLEEFATAPLSQPIVLKDEATLADIAFLEAHKRDFSELELLMMYRRRYPAGRLGAHLFGYVGEASKEEIATGRHTLGEIIGKKGLERQYNHVLQGRIGERRAMVDSQGREVSRLDYKQPVSGRPLRVSIDHDLQRTAEQLLEGRQGAIVALNPQTGDVLALVSRPAFDSNLFAFAGRIPPEEWQRLMEDPAKPLFNRAIQAQLAPGSVFKIILIAAALEEGLFEQPFTVRCNGFAVHYGRVFRCWRPEGHGTVGLHEAIVHSCDVFFYEVGKRLGIERIAYYADKFGLGQPTGIDLPGEEGGLVPSPEWKQRVRKQAWWSGETISVAIGQGPIMVTPVQLAYALGGIASGGVFARPRLILEPDDGNSAAHVRRFPLKEKTVLEVTNGMWGVVNEGGTGGLARIPELDVAGKTGTAQLIGLDTQRQVGAQKQFVDNAWFVGMVPRRNPELVVSVLLEHGEHGAAAAPLARALIRAYYEKKRRGAPAQYARTLNGPAPEAH